MSKYESDFIANLIYYRELRGYTQSVLAGLCDRTKGNIGVIESGKSAPSFEMILKIADALEIHPALTPQPYFLLPLTGIAHPTPVHASHLNTGSAALPLTCLWSFCTGLP